MQITTDGIILKEVKTGESDRILTILTREQGVVSAVAKHSLRLKNKLSSATGLLTWADLTLFPGKSLYTIDEAQSRKVFFELRENMQSLALAMYMAEISAVLAPEGEYAGPYLDFLILGLDELCKAKHPATLVKSAFELRIMAMAGYMPDLVGCRECGQYESAAFYFDIENGELLCADCCPAEGKAPNLSLGALSAMRHILFSQPEKIYAFSLGKENLKVLNRVTDAFLQYYLDRPLKSYDFLMKALEP